MPPSLIPPLKWHGGKQYLAGRIVALMHPHIHYVEPFAGGLAVLFAKPPDGISEVVNDTHGDLVNFWKVLRGEETFERFRRLVEATPFSEPHWRDAAAAHEAGMDDVEPVERAYHFFVLCRQSLAGRMISFAPLSKTRTRRNMNEQASAWWTVVDGLPEVHARLRRVAILNRTAIQVLSTQDGPQTLFYLDPPYLHETRSTTHEYGSHEMGVEQHEALLARLAGIEGRFLLSGYRSELYDSHAKKNGWFLQSFELPNNAASGARKRRMVECIWANYDLDAIPEHLPFAGAQ